VRLGGGPGPRREPPKRPDREKMRAMGRLDTFGIRRVERLDGNVGYIDLRRVAVPANAGPAIARPWSWWPGPTRSSSTCGTTAAGRRRAWSSGAATCRRRPTHLNDIFHADTGETRQFWALPYVPGTRYLDRPVFVLTSGRTFSGGEDFAYTLQALGRATVVGETTGGGAHPTRGFPISAAVHIGIPFARSVNPVTGTNWQGTGVVPDVPADAERACDVAYARALEKVLTMDDVPPPIADDAREALAGLQAAG
jgi:Periplasmic protease